MKKMIILLTSLIFSNVLYSANIYLKGGFTAGGKYEINTKEDVKSSFTAAIDLTKGLLNVEAGVGLGLETGADFKDIDGNMDVTFIPVYLVGKVDILGPYIIGKLGYSFPIPRDSFEQFIDDNHLSLDGGTYYGLGVGYEFTMFVAELFYSVSNGKIEDQDLKYSKLSLMAGIKF